MPKVTTLGRGRVDRAVEAEAARVLPGPAASGESRLAKAGLEGIFPSAVF